MIRLSLYITLDKSFKTLFSSCHHFTIYSIYLLFTHRSSKYFRFFVLALLFMYSNKMNSLYVNTYNLSGQSVGISIRNPELSMSSRFSGCTPGYGTEPNVTISHSSTPNPHTSLLVV